MVEKKSPVAAVKAGEKKTSVEAVKATVSAKKADEVKQAPKAAEKTGEKAAVKTAAVKKPAEKKAAEKKPAAKKTAVKKTAETKAEAQEPVSSVILQYAGREVQAEDWTRRAKEAWTAAGKAEKEIKAIKLYVKPEENMVYYVVNEEMTGSFEL